MLNDITWTLLRQSKYGFPRRCEANDSFAKLQAVIQSGVPKGGNVTIQFGHQAAFRQSFHHGSKRDNTASNKRLDKKPGRWIDFFEPHTNMRYQPRFPTRVTERTTLRDCGNIHRWDR